MQLIIPAEAAHDTVFQLGEVSGLPVARAGLLCSPRPGPAASGPAARARASPLDWAARRGAGAAAAPPSPSAVLAAAHTRPAPPPPVAPPSFSPPQAGLIQFKDLNADKSAFQRTYATQARAPPPPLPLAPPCFFVVHPFSPPARR